MGTCFVEDGTHLGGEVFVLFLEEGAKELVHFDTFICCFVAFNIVGEDIAKGFWKKCRI